MRQIRHRTNGGGSTHAIREELPPPPDERWLLDAAHCDAELTTSHPIFGLRRYDLSVTAGSLTGLPNGQFELILVFQSTTASFKSVSLSRADPVRYIAKGELSVGGHTRAAVITIHDLSWIAGTGRSDDLRLLTISANVDREHWEVASGAIPTPWLTRREAALFLHTEWRPEPGRVPAA